MTFRNGGGSEDPRALLRFMRNALIGIIALVAFAVLVVTCNVDGKPTQPTRTPTYTYPTTSRPTTSRKNGEESQGVNLVSVSTSRSRGLVNMERSQKVAGNAGNPMEV